MIGTRSEITIQFQFAHFLRSENIRFFHVPNGGQRDIREAAKFKRLGLSPGVPDIVIPYSRCGYHGLYIEIKREGGGRVSKYQKEWIDFLNEQGYLALVGTGLDECINAVKDYFREDKNVCKPLLQSGS